MAGIKFPFLCKPLVAQGSNDAHKVFIFYQIYSYIKKYVL